VLGRLTPKIFRFPEGRRQIWSPWAPAYTMVKWEERVAPVATFTVYALSVEKLDVPADSSGAMVVSTANDHLLGKAVFVAHYGR
jgi:hypothetical protein